MHGNGVWRYSFKDMRTVLRYSACCMPSILIKNALALFYTSRYITFDLRYPAGLVIGTFVESPLLFSSRLWVLVMKLDLARSHPLSSSIATLHQLLYHIIVTSFSIKL